jgi:acetoin utilization protein AcuB
VTIGDDRPLAEAHARMRQHEIRHLPVLRRGQLVGVVSDRDLALCEAMEEIDTARTSVEEAMTTDVWSVAPEMPLIDAVSEMIRHKRGCAIVVEGNQVVGVLTTIDALAALRHLLFAA